MFPRSCSLLIPRRICLLVGIVFSLLATVTTFTTRPALATFRRRPALATFRRRPAASICLSKTTMDSEKDSDDGEEPVLSDVDAKVLRSMLEDTEKLDLRTETNMKRLLERGVKAKETPTEPPKVDDEDEDSQYSSKALKTLANTKLWRALRAKAGAWLQSTSIFLSNRVERDAKLLASVGVYALNRAATDLARALPAARSAGSAVGKAVLQLGNSSSFQDMQEAYTNELVEQRRERMGDDIRDQLNTPLDEIKTVSQAIRDILSGEVEGGSAATSSRRGLRNVAQAGQAKMGERQRRAFKRRQETTLREEKRGPIGSAGSTVKNIAGAAYEVRQELRGERSLPGYRTKELRNAIEAGAESTTKFIEAARRGDREAWRGILFGSDDEDDDDVIELRSAEIEREPTPTLDSFMNFITEDEEEWEEPDTSAYDAILELQLPDVTVYEAEEVPLPTELFEEPANVVERLRYCISNPDETWLTRDVLRSRSKSIDEKALREVVTAMICSRDELETKIETLGRPTKTIDEVIKRLKPIKEEIDTISSLAKACAGPGAAASLRNALYGVQEEDDDGVLLLLDEFKADWEADVQLVLEEARAKTESSKATRQAAELAKEEARVAKQELIEESEGRKEELRLAREAAEAKRLEERRRAAEEADRVAAAEAAAAKEPSKEKTDSKRRFSFFSKGKDTEKKTIYVQDVEVVSSDSVKSNGPQSALSKPTGARDAIVTSVETTSTVEVVADDPDEENVIAATSVEIVSDEEFEETELGAGPRRVAADGEELESEEEKAPDNLFVLLALRSLDILFLVLEKVFIVGLPSLFSAGGTATKRIAELRKGGLGSKGWKRLGNARKGEKRY